MKIKKNFFNNPKKPEQIEKNRSQSTQLLNNNSKRLSQLASKQLPSNRHCPQDQACLHCCQCWINHKKQYQKRTNINQNRINTLIKQNQLLKKCIQRLTKQNLQLKQKNRLNGSVQAMKQQIRKQLEEQSRIKELLYEEKISHLSNLVQEIQKKLTESQAKNQRLLNQLIDEKVRSKQLINKCQRLKEQMQKQIQERKKLIHSIDALKEDNIKLNERVEVLDSALRDKTDNISKIQSTLDHSDRLIFKHKNTIAQKDFQNQKLNRITSHKSQIIEKIAKANFDNCQSIHLLSEQKDKLNGLVCCLKDQLIQNDQNNHILKIALSDAQRFARQKSISLESLKHDVSLLKYTL